jgi:general secretion pathway protein I
MSLDMRKGFTLLEVMVALAIMAGVILTLLGAVNYHLGVIANERHSTELTLLARYRLAELESSALPDKSEGTFAPSRPDIKWKAELVTTELPALKKLIIRVQRSGDKEEVTLVRYILK